MKRFKPFLAAFLSIAFLQVVSSPAALAQDDNSASTPAPQQQQQPVDEDTPKNPAAVDQPAQNQKPGDISVSTQSDSTDVPPESFERQPVNLSTGQVLSKTRSPLHWGRLSVMSFELMQIYDSNYLFLKDNPLSAQAGAVQGLLVYSLKSSRASLNLQYRPQFWASDQTQQFDYSSHMVDFHTFRYLTPRWAINVSDQFQYSPDRGRLNEVGFSPDYSTGTSTQNPFLSTGRRMVNNHGQWRRAAVRFSMFSGAVLCCWYAPERDFSDAWFSIESDQLRLNSDRQHCIQTKRYSRFERVWIRSSIRRKAILNRLHF